jgi:hypothetical protein
MLIAVSKTVFISMCAPLLAIYFGTSVQLVSSDLRFCHDGGSRGAGERGRPKRKEIRKRVTQVMTLVFKLGLLFESFAA